MKILICWKVFLSNKISEKFLEINLPVSGFLALLLFLLCYFEGFFFFFSQSRLSSLKISFSTINNFALLHICGSTFLLCCQGNNLLERSGDVAIGIKKVLKNTNVSLI